MMQFFSLNSRIKMESNQPVFFLLVCLHFSNSLFAMLAYL